MYRYVNLTRSRTHHSTREDFLVPGCFRIVRPVQKVLGESLLLKREIRIRLRSFRAEGTVSGPRAVMAHLIGTLPKPGGFSLNGREGTIVL